MKKLFSALLAALILTGMLGGFAFAAGTGGESGSASYEMSTVIPPDEDDVIDFSRFEGKSFEEIKNAFFEENGVDPETLSFGYYNTVTGESLYHNGDRYMVAASIYKLPLNMYYSNLVARGEIDWTTTYDGVPYENIQVSSMISSNNVLSEALQEAIGDYREYRTAIAPLLDVDIDTVEEKYFEGNEFTARQIIAALQKLHNNQDTYPRVEYYMFMSAPDNFFTYSEHRYQVAQKYGLLSYNGHEYYNAAAIVRTPDPILIVMFTDNCAGSIQTLSNYCTLMCDYSEYTRYLRENSEPEPEPTPETAEPVPETEPAPTPAESHEPTPTPTVTAAPEIPSATPAPEKEGFEFTKIHKLIAVGIAAGLFSLIFFGLKKLRPFSGVLAVIFLMIFGVAVVALCTVAVGNLLSGTLFPEWAAGGQALSLHMPEITGGKGI